MLVNHLRDWCLVLVGYFSVLSRLVRHSVEIVSLRDELLWVCICFCQLLLAGKLTATLESYHRTPSLEAIAKCLVPSLRAF